MKACKRFVWIAILAGVSVRLPAGEIEPRAYVNTPVGVSFLLFGYGESSGGLSTVASSPIKDAELDMSTELLAYAYSFGVMGKSAKIDAIVPYSDLSGTARVSGELREREVDGFNDPRIRFSINFLGAPAMSMEEFAGFRQDLIVGGSVQVSAPVGQYDDSKLINLGTNRWFVKPDIGVSKAWGDWALELSSGVFLFTDNRDYYGDATLKQDPLYTSQAHLTYTIRPGMWAALSATLDHGGCTQVDGVQNDDEQSNSRFGATFAMSLNKNNSLKFYASEALRTDIGNDYLLYGVVWQYRWGGGL